MHLALDISHHMLSAHGFKVIQSVFSMEDKHRHRHRHIQWNTGKRICKRIKCIFFSSGNCNNNSKCKKSWIHALAQRTNGILCFAAKLRWIYDSALDYSSVQHSIAPTVATTRTEKKTTMDLNAILHISFCIYKRMIIDCFDSAKM